MRIPYLKWAVFFLAVVLLEQFVFKFISQDVLPSLDDKKVMAALSTFTSGDEPTWESFDDEIRIPIERRGGLWAVNVEFNNYHEANLIIDSGANITTLSSDFAFDLGLTEKPYLPKIPMKTANGTTQGMDSSSKIHPHWRGSTEQSSCDGLWNFRIWKSMVYSA